MNKERYEAAMRNAKDNFSAASMFRANRLYGEAQRCAVTGSYYLAQAAKELKKPCVH